MMRITIKKRSENMPIFWKQTLEAAFWTFLETFLAAFAVAWSGVGVGQWEAAYGAAGAAALAGFASVASLVKSLIVRNIGEQDSTLISG
jgi:hypothetical protein